MYICSCACKVRGVDFDHIIFNQKVGLLSNNVNGIQLTRDTIYYSYSSDGILAEQDFSTFASNQDLRNLWNSPLYRSKL